MDGGVTGNMLLLATQIDLMNEGDDHTKDSSTSFIELSQ